MVSCTDFNMQSVIKVNLQNDIEEDDSDTNFNEILQKTAEKLKNQSRDGQSIYEEFSKCTMHEDNDDNQKIEY